MKGEKRKQSASEKSGWPALKGERKTKGGKGGGPGLSSNPKVHPGGKARGNKKESCSC